MWDSVLTVPRNTAAQVKYSQLFDHDAQQCWVLIVRVIHSHCWDRSCRGRVREGHIQLILQLPLAILTQQS